MSFMRIQIEKFTSCDPELWASKVCQNCYCFVANGECGDESYNPDVIPEGNWATVSADNAGNEIESIGFSQSGCEFCNNGLGCAQYSVVDLNECETVEGYRWRLSTPGYSDCTNWTFHESVVDLIDDILDRESESWDDDDYSEFWSEILCLFGVSILFSEFWESYILAMMWTGHRFKTESDDGNSAYPGSGEFSDSHCYDELWDELTSDQQLDILTDCVRFLRDIVACENAAELLQLFSDNVDQFGTDFHLTRNRHGAGFWDRGHDELGKQLTEISHSFGESSLTIYGMTFDEWANGRELSGPDIDILTSLFEYGLCWETGNEKANGDIRFWYVTEQTGENHDDSGKNTVGLNWADFSPDCDYRSEFNWVDNWGEVFPDCELSELEFPLIVYGLLGYYGTENVFGTDYHGTCVTLCETESDLTFEIGD